MLSLKTALTALIVLLAPAALTHGQTVNVDRWVSGDNWTTISTHASGANITINAVGSNVYRVYGVNGTESIGVITINSSGSNQPVLFVGRRFSEPVTPLPQARVHFSPSPAQ